MHQTPTEQRPVPAVPWTMIVLAAAAVAAVGMGARLCTARVWAPIAGWPDAGIGVAAIWQRGAGGPVRAHTGQ